ncbi:MAG: acyltransferase family protein [Acidimicrobiales bacterium]
MRPAPDDAAPIGDSKAPRGAGRRLAYQPALDGVRALAIVAVLFYHGGVSFHGSPVSLAQGGFLGVEVFFVLSGFLITSLLVAEFADRHTVGLRQFWSRRARRLLPALFCLVAAVGFYQAVAGSSAAVPDLLPDGLATLFYVGNWHQIWTGAGYFAQTARPSPLQHTWSLAIEEQFYLVWPLIVLGILRLAGRFRPDDSGRSRGLKALLVLAVAGSVASAAEMSWLFHGGGGLNRVYYGTDTRAQGLLAGAALSVGLALWRERPERDGRPAGRQKLWRQWAERDGRPAGWRLQGRAADGRPAATVAALGVLGLAGLAAVIGGMYLAGGSGGTGGGIYRGGFLVFDVAVVALIASVALAPAAPAARLLATWPLRSIGRISYGLYLWHYPLFIWLDEQSTGLAGWSLFVVRVGATFAVSIASYLAIEQPIRQRRWPAWAVRVAAAPAAAVAVAALVVASGVPSAAGVGTVDPPPNEPTTTVAPIPGVSWAGDQGPCSVRLPTTIPAYETFHTCPPVRAMVMGDSMALTLAFGLGSDQQHYGVLLSDDAAIGCSFGVRGLGQWGPGLAFSAQFTPCRNQFATWRAEEKAVHPQALVVLMGYWDCFNWQWGGHEVHIGQPAFDSYLFSRMELFVRTEGAGGIPVVVLTVPYVDPAPFADGSPAPASSAQRHGLINGMLARLAAAFPRQVHLVDLDSYVSPGNHFDATVDGHLCRYSDGIHFAPYCGAIVGAHVLPLIRQLVEARGGPGPLGPRRYRPS